MIYKHLSQNASKAPEKIAVIQGQRRVTYQELDRGVSRLALFLTAQTMNAGDRVAILIENSPEYIISYLGVHKAGGISVSVNTQSSSYEIWKILDDCLPTVIITGKKYLGLTLKALDAGTSVRTIIVADALNNDELTKIINKNKNASPQISWSTLQSILQNSNNNRTLPFVDKNDIASIIYTSGTTGKPKGVMLSHNNFEANACSIIEYLHLTEDDRNMVVLPFNYSYGTSLLTTTILAGGSMVLENSFMFPNIILDKMIQEDVTGFAGVPSTFALLLHRSNIREYRFPRLRYITQAGGPMSPEHAKELGEVLSGTDIYIMYGQTEATARLTYLEPGELSKTPGSIGKAIPGVRIEILKKNGDLAEDGETGEIIAQGDNIMVGYWNNPEETTRVLKDGWLYTGDIAKRDRENCLRIIGRRSEMIKSGAHRISPKEIEEVILEMPEVHEVAVIGAEDKILGVIVKAVIVLKEECCLEVREVQRHCSQKLASFKIPKKVDFLEELPKTSSGKVKKYLIEKTVTLD